VQFVREQIPLKRGDKHVCVLPLAHAYGLTFDFLLEFVVGCHIYFLTRMPSPKVIFQAFKEMKPTLIILVPLYVEKLVKKNIIPMLDEPKMQFMLKLPVLKDVVKKKIRAKLIEVFGGNFSQLVIGGAPLNDETESLLKMVGFPYTVGYGMTECGPLISFAPYDSFKERSCGRQIDRMELKIDSPDPENIPGEIMTRGDNVALGYYKNPKATAEVFDEDGWLHTGDLALMDKEGNVTIKGRSKNMLLGSNGQNVYPEEIEDKYSSLSLVSECIVVSKDSKLVALVHPDYKMAMEQGMNSDDIEKQLEEDRKEINKILPKYSQVAAVKVHAEEFEKTPKRSIKRFLY
jgi:long-chain acyl-CoA synthetase